MPVLPKDVYSVIISKLEPQDLASARLVSHQWRKLAVQVANNRVLARASNEWTITPKQSAGLWAAKTPRDLGSAARAMGRAIADGMKEWSVEELAALRTRGLQPHLSKLFGDVISLAEIYHDIETFQIAAESRVHLGKYVRPLADAGDPDRALEVAFLALAEGQRFTRRDFFGTFMDAGHRDHAYALIKAMPPGEEKTEALIHCSGWFFRAGNVERAREVAQTIPHQPTQEALLERLSLPLEEAEKLGPLNITTQTKE